MTFQQKLLLALIGIVIGGFVAATLAENYVQRGAARLDPDVRERVYQRLVRWDLFYRLLDTLGIALVVLGVAKLFKFLDSFSFGSLAWGFPAIAAGVSVFCLERMLRSWGTFRAYRMETDTEAARGRAFFAALLITAVELALAVGVCWYVFSNGDFLKQLRGKMNPSEPMQEEAPANLANPTSENPSSDHTRFWVNEAEALKILEKDKQYLDLVVPNQQIRTKTSVGQTFYRRDDLETLKRDGMPSLEELMPKPTPESEPAPAPPPPAPPPPPSQPPPPHADEKP